MKYFNKIQIFLTAMMMLAFISCSQEGEYTLEEAPPLDFHAYYNGLTVTFVNAAEGASNVSWNFGDGTANVTGDSVEHIFGSTGNYVITMSATLNSKSYTFHTMLRVDKPSVIDLEDGSFDDWNEISYPDFSFTGKGAVDTAKVDYDANYIYIYVEFDSVAENAGLADHIFGVYIDADNTVSSGFSMKEMGVDYSCEGNIYEGGWFAPSIVDLANGDPGWPFVGFDNENALIPGYMTKEGNTIKMEFALSREVFKINSDAVAFSMSIMDVDWSDVGNVVTPLPEFSERIVVLMNKE